MFGRLRRQTFTQEDLPPEDEPPVPSPTRPLHHRDSSLRSLSSGVSEFRRSTSLRSHHSQISTGTGFQRRNNSSGNLLQSPNLDNPAGSPTPPSPPRHRSKLSFSTRPFSRSLKSSEALPLFDADPIPDVPQISADQKKPFSMLTVAPFNRNERQFSSQVNLSLPPSSHGDPVRPPPSSHGQNPQAVYQQIQETAAKRMSTIHYIRRLHEGDVYFFNTMHVSQSGLSAMPMFNPQKMGRRAASYFHLGHSLPIILDLKSGSALEYLKPLTLLLQEFETYQSLAGVDGTGSLSRRGMGAMLKSGMGLGKTNAKGYRRSSTATDISEVTTMSTSTASDLTGYAANEFTYLLTPQLPYEPDFGTAFSTLCDTLIDMYSNLMALISGPEVCTVPLAEAFSKADKAIRKILVANVVKEFEEHSRNSAKIEVAGLTNTEVATTSISSMAVLTEEDEDMHLEKRRSDQDTMAKREHQDESPMPVATAAEPRAMRVLHANAFAITALAKGQFNPRLLTVTNADSSSSPDTADAGQRLSMVAPPGWSPDAALALQRCADWTPNLYTKFFDDL